MLIRTMLHIVDKDNQTKKLLYAKAAAGSSLVGSCPIN